MGLGAGVGVGGGVGGGAGRSEISELVGNRTVEEVINEWHKELQAQTRAFGKHAGTVQAWDRQLIEHRGFLLQLEADLGVVLASQDALERQLEILQVHQGQVDDVLAQVKSDLERSFREARDGSDAGDPAIQRDAIYEAAEEVSTHASTHASALVRLFAR